MGVARLYDCCLKFTIVGTTIRHVYFTSWVLVGCSMFTNQTGRCCPSKWMDFKLLEYSLDCLLARQQIKGVSTWSNRKTHQLRAGRMVYGFTEQKIHVGDIPYIYICIHIRQRFLCYFSDSSSSSPFQRFNTIFLLQQIYVVYFARLRLWNERCIWVIYQVVGRSVTSGFLYETVETQGMGPNQNAVGKGLRLMKTYDLWVWKHQSVPQKYCFR